MKANWEILGLGCAAIDDILLVPRYPEADAKVEVHSRERHCGGLTATALVAAARLGARCAYAGTLGEDADSRFVLETLRRERIDVSQVVCRAQAGPIRSVIIVDEERQTRNIFYQTDLVRGADPRRPSAELIRSAQVLLVDRFGIPGMIRAARIARRSGVAVLGDFENASVPRFEELFALVDHLIVSEQFVRNYLKGTTPQAAADQLWKDHRAAVVITTGARGCWYRDGSMPKARQLPAFRVKAVDTTGCGDVFHGAYAAALVRGKPLLPRLYFASAAAALKATQPGGQAGIPTRAAVEAFLGRYHLEQ